MNSVSVGSPMPELPASLFELRAMIRDRKLTKEAFESREFNALWSSVKNHLHDDDPTVVWATFSTIGRMASVSKPAQRLAEPLLKQRLEAPLPSFVRLSDGEDRYYLAKSLEYGSRPEISDIAFRELAEEETAETARRVWADISGAAVDSLTAFLFRLNSEIEVVVRESNLNPDTVCRRLRRIGSAIEDYLATADLDAGEQIGRQLKILFVGHLPSSGPEDRTLREEASRDFLAMQQKIARLNFNARTDPESYILVDEMRGWWRPASPPQAFESAARDIARLGVESLFLFAKQGVMNKPLRGALVTAAGKHLITTIARDFAERARGLDESIAYWFVNGEEPREARSARAVEALSEAKLDEYVARLLIALEAAELQPSAVEQALGDVKDIMPAEGETLERAVRRIAPIKQWARAIARSRRIELNPHRSESVRYDPNAHSGEDHLKIGSEVRVTSPGVVKEGRGGIKVVLVKAEVE